jgi:hypothetical protein
LYAAQGIEDDVAQALEAETLQFVEKYGSYAADCVRETGDVTMILHDIQPTFQGRYVGRRLLPHLQKCLGKGHQHRTAGRDSA